MIARTSVFIGMCARKGYTHLRASRFGGRARSPERLALLDRSATFHASAGARGFQPSVTSMQTDLIESRVYGLSIAAARGEVLHRLPGARRRTEARRRPARVDARPRAA